MRFLLDENVSPAVRNVLIAAGHEATLVAQLMPSSSDREIVLRARSEGSIVITEDKDFGMLCFKDGLHPPGLVRVAMRKLDLTVKTERIVRVVAAEGVQLMGCITTIEPGRVRHTRFP